MRRTFTVTAALAALLVASPAEAIVYGQPDGILHPNVGTMAAEWREPGVIEPFCSGTLVDQDTFITASHCTVSLASSGIEPDDVWVSFDPQFDQAGTLYPGTYVTNSAYNGFSGPGGHSDPGDIAVVELDEPILHIEPAQLPTEGLLPEMKAAGLLKDQVFTAVGYGTIRETRRGAFGSILDNTERRYALQSYLSLQKAWLKLAMNEATGDGGTCYGDSGGPHFLGGADSNLMVSITVTGDAVCKATDVTYRVDTESARSFLEAFVDLP